MNFNCLFAENLQTLGLNIVANTRLTPTDNYLKNYNFSPHIYFKNINATLFFLQKSMSTIKYYYNFNILY